MDEDKAIRAAKLTLGGMLEKRRAKGAVERAQGQIAPSKYLPGVPRAVHAYGGRANEKSDVWWHGSPSGDLRGGVSGLHLGTKEAALDALRARIGVPADGSMWDGTKEYGRTLLAGKNTLNKMGKYLITGHNAHAPDEDYYPHQHPKGFPTVGAGVPVDPSWRPFLKPFKIVGPMTNSLYSPHGDSRANAMMKASLTKGSAKNGYYYTNDGEDSGSISAVVPNGSHVVPLDDVPKQGYTSGSEESGDPQEGTLYLDAVRATGMKKMGGIRSVKADGGSVGDPRAAFLAGNHPAVPDTVYHGSAPKIATKGWTSEVDEEQTQKNRDAMDFRTFKPSEYGNYGPGIYLTDKPGTASQYAMGIRADQNEEKPYGQVMKLHVSMKQPFTDDVLKHPAWRDYIKDEIKNSLWLGGIGAGDRAAAAGLVKKLDDGTATVRDLFLTDTENGTMVNQFGHDRIHKTIRNSGFDGIIGHRPDGSKEIVAFKPEQVKSAISARKFDPTNPDMTFAAGGAIPQKTVKAYKLFRTKGDGKLYPLFVNADKPVPIGEWLEAEEGPQGKAQGKVKSKLGDLAYRPGWHAGDLPIATHIGGKSDPSLKKPDYRPDNHVWAEVEMAADKDWQSVADSRGKGVKAHITDQVPLGGFYRYKTNPNMTGNWLIGGNMKVNRVLADDEVKAINDAAGTADLPRLPRGAFAAGGAAMFEGIHEDLQDEQGNPLELWHGTPSEPFDEFKDEKLGSTRDYGFYGRGHYLTPDRDTAEEYTTNEYEKPGTVMGPLHAALKNPYIWDTSSDNASHRTLRDLQSMGIMREKSKMEPWDNLQRHHIEPFMSEMQKRGHDGVVVRSTSYDDRPHQVSEVVVFNPNMIKHKDAEVFDPNDPRIMRADGGEVDDNTPIDMTTARLLRNFNQNSTGPTPQAEGVFNRLADRYEKSRVAYDAAKADGVFDRVQIGDVYKYKPLPNTSPMEVVGHRMMPVERWSGDKPPKYVYHDHYPVADIKKDGETKPYSIERMEDADLYDRIKGKPRMVRADGGMVDKALAATRSFTKDGGAAIMRLKD